MVSTKLEVVLGLIAITGEEAGEVSIGALSEARPPVSTTDSLPIGPEADTKPTGLGANSEAEDEAEVVFEGLLVLTDQIFHQMVLIARIEAHFGPTHSWRFQPLQL